MDQTFSIGFYNLENLFDPGEKEGLMEASAGSREICAWNEGRYRKKIENLSTAISKIGASESMGPPVFMGVCEVETDRCLEDLVSSEALRSYGYGFVHHKSKDRRGLDTAFLYRKSHFRVLSSYPYSITVRGKSGEEATRDILHVEGELFSVRLHILVNHWPSRLEGRRSTKHKRNALAKELKRVVDHISHLDPQSKIMLVGDFNDNPTDFSLKKLFDSSFTNTLDMANQSTGTAMYRKRWVFFDQILLNENLLNSSEFTFSHAQVFNPPFLVQHQGRHKGAPKRTFQARHYLGGYSDHFPVYALFEYHGSIRPRMSTLSRS